MKSSQTAMKTTFFFSVCMVQRNFRSGFFVQNFGGKALENTRRKLQTNSDLRSTVSKDVYDQIRYNILKESYISPDSYFKVDNNNGSLYTASAIDRENLSVITAYFRKFDVWIEIEDINDNNPRFPKENIDLELSESTPLRWYITCKTRLTSGTGQRDSYMLTIVAEDGGTLPLSNNLTVNIVITDNTAIGTLLVKLEAMDSDMEQNGEVIYRLSHRQVKNFPELVELFSADENSGELKLKGTIIFDTPETKYDVIVEDSDKGVNHYLNNNPPDININILGDHSAAIISEYAEEGTAFAYVEVLDNDIGINAVIGCNIENDVFKLQSIDINEYKVIVKTMLDRETAAFHNVALFCEEKGTPTLNESASFIVQVKDENDNRPIFNQEIYIVDINENIADADVGFNGYVHYTVEPSGYHIYFDSNCNIWTSSVFDRETENRITFNVFAIDAGIPYTNDNDLLFTEKIYLLNVTKNLPIDTIVGQITVTDQDIGKNGEISLIIDGHFPFTIDYFGLVKTAEKLDREIERRYNFIIIAFDHGVPSRNSTCSIAVNITDTNDNSPVFISPSVSKNTVVLPYPINPWTFASQIKAYDLNDRPNRQMLYSLENSGEIFLLRELTLADKTSYYLQIRIDDQEGEPSNFATQVLNVMITFSVSSHNVTGSRGENLIIAISSTTNHVADSGLFEKDANLRNFQSANLQTSDLHNELSNEKTLNGDHSIIPVVNGGDIATRENPVKNSLGRYSTKVVKCSYEDNDSQTSAEAIQSDSGRGGSDSDMYSPICLHAHDCEFRNHSILTKEENVDNDLSL
ncbi:hypothetical protein ACJMK2_031460 [Sinanodonta woodiana]|uniref:Cadherin domain-containing protein n=1 Tax=Sinanodonta woodiana TaxID=1069815 RepID=A0ABD3X097_SINWO